MVRDWWPQWRSPEQHLQEPVLYKLVVKSNNSSSIKLLSHTDRAFPGSAACDAAQERRKKYFSGRVPTASVHVVMLISLQHQAYWTCLLYRISFIFDAVLENIAFLYALPTSSGSHHFVTTKDFCPGWSSTVHCGSKQHVQCK